MCEHTFHGGYILVKEIVGLTFEKHYSAYVVY